MKKLVLALSICLGLSITGCAAEGSYDPPPAVPYAAGSVEFCDDWGCRWVNAPYYYSDGDLFYWDAHFGVWVGPRGWWHGGIWHSGFVPGYHGWYHAGHYHVLHSGWRGTGGGHSYGHGGGGHHR